MGTISSPCLFLCRVSKIGHDMPWLYGPPIAVYFFLLLYAHRHWTSTCCVFFWRCRELPSRGQILNGCVDGDMLINHEPTIIKFWGTLLTPHMGVGQNLLLSILMGWTSIYQLFWGSLGARVLTNSHMFLWYTPCHGIPIYAGLSEDMISQNPTVDHYYHH